MLNRSYRKASRYKGVIEWMQGGPGSPSPRGCDVGTQMEMEMEMGKW